MTLHELVEKAKAAGISEYTEIKIFKDDPYDLAHGGSFVLLESDKVDCKSDGVFGDRIYIKA